MRTWACEAGTFSGYETERCFHVRGIRYATSKRFEAPVPYSYEPGVHECIETSPFAVQLDSGLENNLMGIAYGSMKQEESCQYLSITIPKTEQKYLRSVMVWFHGGGFHHGGCDSEAYDYELLAAEQDVILVGVNYRLGILGFGKTADGRYSNNGLKDAIESLKWIKANIASFGGDPDRVTLFGQSAGAELVRCIILSESTEALYRRAILQSDPIGAMRSREAMEQEILTAAQAVPDDADLETILQTEAEILSGVKEKGIAKYLKFAPHFGIAPLPPVEKTEARLQEVAAMHELLIGSTTREVSVYGGQIKPLIALDSFRLTEPVIEKIMKGLSASIFIEPAEEFARMYALAGGTVYLYTFYWREGKAYLGAGHTIDILPLFGGKRAEGHAIAMGLTADEIAEKGKPMRAVWASFAKDGEPSNLHVSGMLRIHKL